jgi:hypothetical protein
MRTSIPEVVVRFPLFFSYGRGIAADVLLREEPPRKKREATARKMTMMTTQTTASLRVADSRMKHGRRYCRLENRWKVAR